METPIISALVDVISVVMAKSYRNEALRTTDSLGLAGKSVAELSELLA